MLRLDINNKIMCPWIMNEVDRGNGRICHKLVLFRANIENVLNYKNVILYKTENWTLNKRDEKKIYILYILIYIF